MQAVIPLEEGRHEAKAVTATIGNNEAIFVAGNYTRLIQFNSIYIYFAYTQIGGFIYDQFGYQQAVTNTLVFDNSLGNELTFVEGMHLNFNRPWLFENLSLFCIKNMQGLISLYAFSHGSGGDQLEILFLSLVYTSPTSPSKRLHAHICTVHTQLLLPRLRPHHLR